MSRGSNPRAKAKQTSARKTRLPQRSLRLESLEERRLLAYDLVGAEMRLTPPIIPGYVEWGANINADVTLRNLGDTAIVSPTVVKVDFVLSANTSWGDSDDVLLRTVDYVGGVPGSNVGPRNSYAITLTKPADLAYESGGPFYIGLKVDSDNAIAETGTDAETNNGPGVRGEDQDFDRFSIRTERDLVAKSFDIVPTKFYWGRTFDVAFQVRNGGDTAIATPFTQSFYLSPNADFTDADNILLPTTYTHVAPVPANGDGPAATLTLTLPGTAPAGFTDTVYVGMKTDSGNAVLETFEQNNGPGVGSGVDYDSFALTIEPDLVGLSFTAPTVLNWGQTFTVTGRVANNGGSTVTGDFVQRFYLSNNLVFGDADDISLGTYTHTADLAAGAQGAAFNVTLTMPLVIPAGYVSTGPFYLGMWTDHSATPPGVATEGDEANNKPGLGAINTDWAQFSVPASVDLIGRALDVPDTLVWGQAFTINARVENIGILPVTADFDQQFVLSMNNVFGDADDLLLGTFRHTEDLPGATAGTAFTLNAVMPTTAPAGYVAGAPMYVGMRTDATAAVAETNENNNRPAGRGLNLDYDVLTLGPMPDLLSLVCRTPDSMEWGTAIDVNYQVRNNGNAAAGAFGIGWYLSRDAVWSADDLQVNLDSGAGEVRIPSLAAGANSTAAVARLRLPDTAPVGWNGLNYYLIQYVDRNGEVAEQSESNNNGQLGLEIDYDTLALSGGIDLAGHYLWSSDGAWGGQVIVGTTVANAGAFAADPFYVNWYLSRDAYASGDDILLSQAGGRGPMYLHGGLAGKSVGPYFGVTLQLPTTRPVTFVGEDFHIVQLVDAGNYIGETNEGNNFGQMGAGVDGAPVRISGAPDLQGLSLLTSAASAWGGTVAASFQVRNAGTEAAGPFQTSWYLSQDAVGSADDVLLQLSDGTAAFVHPTLAAGADGGTYQVVLRLPAAMPAGFSGGRFHIIQRLDGNQAIVESDELNNFGQMGVGKDWRAIDVASIYDVQGAVLQAPDTAWWGQTIEVASQLYSGGSGPVGPFAVQWYLSADRTGSAGDVLLNFAGGGHTYIHGAMNPLSYGPRFSVQLVLPTALPPGWAAQPLFIVQRVDAANVLVESNEGNNFGELADGWDREPIAIGPRMADLAGLECTAADTAWWGGTISVLSQVQNVGTAAAGNFQMQWYLSRDEAGSADDLPLSIVGLNGPIYVHGGLAAGAVGPRFAVSLQLPPTAIDGLASGQYHIIQRVDSSSAVAEGNEDNNFGQLGPGRDRDIAAIMTAMPDLHGASLWAYGASSWGQTIELLAQARNSGPVASSAFNIEWYLSGDPVASADDLRLPLDAGGTSYRHAGIAAGTTAAQFSARVRLPSAPPAGFGANALFYLLQRTDAAGEVAETNEYNNFGELGGGLDLRAISIAAPNGVDLVGNSITATGAALWGQTVAVQTQVANAGNQAAGAFGIQWYLSRDQLGSADDILLARRPSGTTYAHAGIAGNATGPTLNVTLQLPTAAPAGWTGSQFYLVQKTDSGSAVAELVEGNNFGTAGVGRDAAEIAIMAVPFVSQLSATGSGTNYLSPYAAATMLAGNAWSGSLATTATMQNMALAGSGSRYPSSHASATQVLAGLNSIAPAGAPTHGVIEDLDLDGVKALLASGTPVSVTVRYSALGTLRVNRAWTGPEQLVLVGYSDVDGTFSYLDPFARTSTAAIRTVSASTLGTALEQQQAGGRYTTLSIR